MQPTTLDAIKLFDQGSLALADIEANGIQIDTDYLASAIKKVAGEQVDLERELKQSIVWNSWQKEFGEKANLHSRPQLASLLFEKMGYRATAWTSGGKTGVTKPSADEEHLKTVDLPFISKYLQLTKLDKIHNTYLKGIERETDDDGFLHPSFNLVSGDDDRGGARSGRGSCQLPNFQNMPIRNKKQGEVIRKCFVPRPGRILVETDFNSLEVRCNASINGDPTLLAYVSDPTTDMHRDMAEELFMLNFKNWDKGQYKDIRYVSKNSFVFASFYGSVYFQTALGLWKQMQRMNLQTPDGKSLKDHLASKGIYELGECDPTKSPKHGTFEYHVWKVEKDFWERRFPIYYAWREKIWKEYQRNGYIDLPTGFRINGPFYQKNAITNYPAQGSGFHILLWCMTEIHKRMKEEGMESLIVGEVHDSMLGDIVLEELTYYIKLCKYYMTKAVRKFWNWIVSPLVIEVEGSTKSWHLKSPISI